MTEQEQNKKLSFILRTREFRGDHDADVEIAYDFPPGYTLRQVLDGIGGMAPGDVLEIRAIREASHD